MNAKNATQGKTYRVNLRLDTQTDAEVIAWLESLPSGRRSTALREIIRLGLGMAVPAQPSIDLETVRQVFADELARSLAGLRFQPQPNQEQQNADDAEAKYGAKLDRMLGGLTASHSETDMNG